MEKRGGVATHTRYIEKRPEHTATQESTQTTGQHAATHCNAETCVRKETCVIRKKRPVISAWIKERTRFDTACRKRPMSYVKRDLHHMRKETCVNKKRDLCHTYKETSDFGAAQRADEIRHLD